jgi:hypothetical protein
MDAERKAKIEAAASSLDVPIDDWAVAEGVVALLTERGEWKKLERAYRTLLRKAVVSSPEMIGGIPRAERETTLWRALAGVYKDRIADDASAIEIYELLTQARTATPEDRLDLASIHERNDRYDAALRVYGDLLEIAPAQPEAYERMFDVHAQRGEVDRAWCVAAALVLLGKASNAIAAFHADHAPRLLPTRGGRLDDDAWAKLQHPDESPVVTEILDQITPAVLPLLPETPSPDEDVVGWACDALGAPGSSTSLAAGGLDDWSRGRSLRERLFLAGREATARRSPSCALAAQAPATLKVLFFGAVMATHTEIPIPEPLAKVAADIGGKIQTGLSAEQRELLRLAMSTLVNHGAKVDFVSWRRSAQITRLRAGLLLSCDPCGVRSLLLEPDESFSVEDRINAAAKFTASPTHHALRSLLGIALGSAA